MSSYTNAWGEGADSQPGKLHQGPARQAALVTSTTHDQSASTAQVDTSNGLQRSNIRPSLAAARSASDRDIRRRRGQTGLMRGPESSTESARERAVDRHFPEINFAELQDNLSRVEVPQHGALLTVIHVTAEDLADSHATAEPESEVPVYHNNLAHIEAPQPKKPVSPLVSPKIPRVKAPDRGIRAFLRRKLSSSERSYLKSGVPKRKWQRVDPDLLYPEKYKDPRPGYSCKALEESSAFEEDDDILSPPASELPPPQSSTEDDSIPSPPASESLPPQSSVDLEEGQYAFSVCRRAHEASTTNLHGWYPGKRVYGEPEMETAEARQERKLKAVEATLNTMFR